MSCECDCTFLVEIRIRVGLLRDLHRGEPVLAVDDIHHVLLVVLLLSVQRKYTVDAYTI